MSVPTRHLSFFSSLLADAFSNFDSCPPHTVGAGPVTPTPPDDVMAGSLPLSAWSSPRFFADVGARRRSCLDGRGGGGGKKDSVAFSTDISSFSRVKRVVKRRQRGRGSFSRASLALGKGTVRRGDGKEADENPLAVSKRMVGRDMQMAAEKSLTDSQNVQRELAFKVMAAQTGGASTFSIPHFLSQHVHLFPQPRLYTTPVYITSAITRAHSRGYSPKD